MFVWKLRSDHIDEEYDEDGVSEDLIFKRENDAETYSKAQFEKFLRVERASEYGDRDMTYEQYVRNYNVKVRKIEVRLDGKTERVIMQRKS